jgi:hypothetical protein
MTQKELQERLTHGECVMLPPGDFVLTEPLRLVPDMHAVGAGGLVGSSDGLPSRLIYQGDPGQVALYAEGRDGSACPFRLENLAVKCATGGRAIHLKKPRGIVRNVTVWFASGPQMVVDQAWHCDFSGLRFRYGKGMALKLKEFNHSSLTHFLAERLTRTSPQETVLDVQGVGFLIQSPGFESCQGYDVLLCIMDSECVSIRDVRAEWDKTHRQAVTGVYVGTTDGVPTDGVIIRNVRTSDSDKHGCTMSDAVHLAECRGVDVSHVIANNCSNSVLQLEQCKDVYTGVVMDGLADHPLAQHPEHLILEED